jgi:hypothetical protein
MSRKRILLLLYTALKDAVAHNGNGPIMARLEA